MPRRVSYRIEDRADGLFDAVALLAPDRIHRRSGFASLAAAEAWIDGLRTLMAAVGAPVVQADAAEFATAAAEPFAGDAPAGAQLRRFREAVCAAETGSDDAAPPPAR